MSNKRDLWQIMHPHMSYPGPVLTLPEVREWIGHRKSVKFPTRDPDLYRIEPVPSCGCCGAYGDGVRETSPRVVRCEKHVGRNPCIIDGCGRTFDNKGDDRIEFVCGKHFRLAPLSLRKGIRRIDRLAKKHGWKIVLRRRHEQLWERVMRDIKGALEGDINMDEINRIMGWD